MFRQQLLAFQPRWTFPCRCRPLFPSLGWSGHCPLVFAGGDNTLIASRLNSSGDLAFSRVLYLEPLTLTAGRWLLYRPTVSSPKGERIISPFFLIECKDEAKQHPIQRAPALRLCSVSRRQASNRQMRGCSVG